MDIDRIFSQPFHRSHRQTTAEIQSLKLKVIDKFPYTEFITEGDQFFKKVWKMIDRSRDYFWITTYAIDSSPAADTTLIKLIEAAKRGVHVVLFADNVQFWAKAELIEELQTCGGRFLLLNPQWRLSSYKSYLNKDVWRRHHEKLIVSDSFGLIGSANIEGSYGGIRYGTSQYQDLNYLTEHVALDQYRQHFYDTAQQYNYTLHVRYSNQTLLQKLMKRYPNSQFYDKRKYRLLHNDKKAKKYEVQNSVIGMITQAQREVKIINPYYYPMLRFDRAVINAVKRGVSAQILTSGQRDQPVFQYIFNPLLFQRLINKGVSIYETKQRLLHSKIYMTDGRYLNLGSMNNDRWSWKINNEVNLAIDDRRDYEWADNYFDKMLRKGRKVPEKYIITADRAALISFWQNFLYLTEGLMSQGTPEQAFIQDHLEIPQLEMDLEKQGAIV